MPTKSSYKISWMMFVSNVVIFLHHANLKDYYPEKVTPVSVGVMDFFSVLAIPAMTWFFFISAYLFFRNLEVSQIAQKWEKRIQSILIPYLLWNTVAVFMDFVKGGVRGNNPLDFLISNYFFINGSGCRNGPLWYMFRLMEFMAFAPIICKIVKSKKLMIISMIGIVVINLIFKIGYFKFSYFLPVYLVGAYIGMNYNEQLESYISGGKFTSEIESEKTDAYGWKYAKLTISIILVIALGYLTTISAGVLGTLLRYFFVLPLLLLLHYSRTTKPCRFILNGGVCGYTAFMTLPFEWYALC